MPESLIPDIVEAIADAKGVDSSEIDTPLQEYIDTDAIDLLASHDSSTWTLSFEIPEHKVTVTSDGLVLIDGARQIVWA